MIGWKGKAEFSTFSVPSLITMCISACNTFSDLSCDPHPRFKEISSVILSGQALSERSRRLVVPTAALLIVDNAPTLLSLSLSRPLFPSSLCYTNTHTPQRNCFPICQKAEHERLKITEDDIYRQTDRWVQEALQPFNLYRK